MTGQLGEYAVRQRYEKYRTWLANLRFPGVTYPTYLGATCMKCDCPSNGGDIWKTERRRRAGASRKTMETRGKPQEMAPSLGTSAGFCEDLGGKRGQKIKGRFGNCMFPFQNAFFNSRIEDECSILKVKFEFQNSNMHSRMENAIFKSTLHFLSFISAQHIAYDGCRTTQVYCFIITLPKFIFKAPNKHGISEASGIFFEEQP